MTNELQNRVAHAENFSTDLVHEIRNPLASLKSASEILQDTNDNKQRNRLLNIYLFRHFYIQFLFLFSLDEYYYNHQQQIE